jgi:anti-sigma regulatory factor (Ser/Thr protein kinase)
MGTVGAGRSAAVRVHAREVRTRSATLRREAEAQKRRTEMLCEQLAANLMQTSRRSFGGRGERFLLRLGRLRPLVRFARNDLRRWLEGAELPPEVVTDVTLACSEACANAVEHANEAKRQLVEIEARRDDAHLELRVRDYGSWTEHRRSDLRGRGIGIIDRLMDTVSIQRHADGTEIVMRRAWGASPRPTPLPVARTDRDSTAGCS